MKRSKDKKAIRAGMKFLADALDRLPDDEATKIFNAMVAAYDEATEDTAQSVRLDAILAGCNNPCRIANNICTDILNATKLGRKNIRAALWLSALATIGYIPSVTKTDVMTTAKGNTIEYKRTRLRNYKTAYTALNLSLSDLGSERLGDPSGIRKHIIRYLNNPGGRDRWVLAYKVSELAEWNAVEGEAL